MNLNIVYNGKIMQMCNCKYLGTVFNSYLIRILRRENSITFYTSLQENTKKGQGERGPILNGMIPMLTACWNLYCTYQTESLEKIPLNLCS